MNRTVFFLSDRTGITAKTLAHSLLTQFEGVIWNKVSCPYIDMREKARAVVVQIKVDRGAVAFAIPPNMRWGIAGIFDDKNWLATDNFPGSPSYGNVYYSYTKFTGVSGGFPIMFSNSTDGGANFLRASAGFAEGPGWDAFDSRSQYHRLTGWDRACGVSHLPDQF